MQQRIRAASRGGFGDPAHDRPTLRAGLVVTLGLAAVVAAPASAQSRAAVQVAARVVQVQSGLVALDSMMRLGRMPAGVRVGLAEIRVLADPIDSQRAVSRPRIIRIDFLRN